MKNISTCKAYYSAKLCGLFFSAVKKCIKEFHAKKQSKQRRKALR